MEGVGGDGWRGYVGGPKPQTKAKPAVAPAVEGFHHFYDEVMAAE